MTTTTTNWFACVPFPQAETPSEANMDTVDAAETKEYLASNEVDAAVEPACVEKDEPAEVDKVNDKSCSPSTYTACPSPTTEESLADEARDDETDGARDDASVLSVATTKVDTKDVIKEERDCGENEALKTKNASNDGTVESNIDEAALTTEGIEITLSGSGLRTNTNPSTSIDKLRSISAKVKNGSIAATTKTGALVKVMHAKMKMMKKEVPPNEDRESKKGILTKVAIIDALNATVKKMRAAKEVPKSDSSSPRGEVELPMNNPACSLPSPPVVNTKPKSPKSASSYEYFQVVFFGNKKTDMMVRLPYNVNTTFQDLRRELEEDFANDLGSSYFKFTITADGIIVSPAQEQKWRVRDYDLTNQGGDGTYKSPFFVYVKKESSKMKRMSLSIKQMRM